MQLSILTTDGFLFLLRWIHFLAGITWIGLLYYLNFVQGEFFKECAPATKSEALQKLLPRALWWFRWAAMVTFIAGLLILQGTYHTGVPLKSSWSVMILTGSLLGTIMWFNVWFVIWPSQKVVIASATQVAQGGQAIPEAADKAARALVASRHNVMFSVPMLFFMGAARHLTLSADFSSNLMPLTLAVLGLVGILEFNALKGKTGPLTSIKGVIHCGLALAVVMYLLIEVLT